MCNILPAATEFKHRKMCWLFSMYPSPSNHIFFKKSDKNNRRKVKSLAEATESESVLQCGLAKCPIIRSGAVLEFNASWPLASGGSNPYRFNRKLLSETHSHINSLEFASLWAWVFLSSWPIYLLTYHAYHTLVFISLLLIKQI